MPEVPSVGKIEMTADSADGFTYDSRELDALASAHNYYAWLAGQFGPYLGADVVEVGAGVGTFSRVLLRDPGIRRLLVVEPADNNVPILRERLAGEPRVVVHHGYFDAVAEPECADSVVVVNVLEHIEDDRGFLELANRALRPGGSLLIFVPALQFLMGTLDEEFHHYRRYSRRALASALGAAGFRSPRIRYVNLPGVAAWFLTGRVLRRRTLSPAAVTFYDRWVIPWLFRLEGVVHPPLGQNLLAIARK